jgi:hypothetical protein
MVPVPRSKAGYTLQPAPFRHQHLAHIEEYLISIATCMSFAVNASIKNITRQTIGI